MSSTALQPDGAGKPMALVPTIDAKDVTVGELVQV